ncbi:MAG: UDP-N-acetylmuramate dehydrogenase [Bacilli bacterium]
MNKFIQEVNDKEIGNILENKLLKDYTTYRVGGVARVIIYPKSKDKLIELLKLINQYELDYKVLGNGSNVIFSDKLYDDVIIKLDELNELVINNNKMRVGAGYSLVKLAMKLSRLGYKGLEFATGIPGSVGGSIFMNAGAYNSDMANVVKEVLVITPALKIKKLTNKNLKFSYRDSFLKRNPNYICIEVSFELEKGNVKDIMELIEDRKRRRLESQPLEYPSAGSVFRNPEGNYAGHLIEECGLKGKKIGGAVVSKKHANFIVNEGNATGEDIKKLIYLVKYKVKDKYNIELHVEQEFVNWE